MWYSSPAKSPQRRVSPDQIMASVTVASVQTVLCPTGPADVPELSSEPDFAPNAVLGAQPVKAMAATAGAVPGTEYWLP
jgi:hypothetical protein